MKPLAAFVLFLASAAFSADVPVLVRLTTPLDAKSVKIGDTVTVVVMQPLQQDGRVVLPKGSRLQARVTYAAAQENKKSDSSLGLLFERAETPAGTVTIDGILQAIAAPVEKNSGDSDDPFSTMSHSMQPNMRAGSGGGGTGAAIIDRKQPTPDQGATQSDGDLTTASQGVVGFEDVYLNLELSNKTQSSVMTATKRNLKLPAGTRMVVQMHATQKWPEPTRQN